MSDKEITELLGQMTSDAGLKEYINQQHVKRITQIVKYCRHLQKEYMEGAGTLSGIDMAHSFLQNGSIQLSTLIGIYDAIRNYNTPFEVTNDETNSI